MFSVFEKPPESPLPTIVWRVTTVLYYAYTAFVVVAIIFKVCASPWMMVGSGAMAWITMTGLSQGEMGSWAKVVRYSEKPITYWMGVLVGLGGVVMFLLPGMYGIVWKPLF